MTPPPPAPSPYRVIRPTGAAGALVFASPHSGEFRPEDMRPAADLSITSLRSAEDALVDRLIASGPDHGAVLIAGRTSRAYVDLNRDPGELDPDLIDAVPVAEVGAKTRAGFGVLPRRAGDGAPLYDRRLSLVEARTRLAAVHAPYHAALADLMHEAHARCGRAVLVDWHSMPSRAVSAGLRRASAVAPDVVLGDRHGTACDPGLTRRLRTLFETAGLRVALNAPYAGGYSTQVWARPAEGFHAIQIELNRALYLDETTLAPSDGFGRCQALIGRVVAGLSADIGLR